MCKKVVLIINTNDFSGHACPDIKEFRKAFGKENNNITKIKQKTLIL